MDTGKNGASSSRNAKTGDSSPSSSKGRNLRQSKGRRRSNRGSDDESDGSVDASTDDDHEKPGNLGGLVLVLDLFTCHSFSIIMQMQIDSQNRTKMK